MAVLLLGPGTAEALSAGALDPSFGSGGVVYPGVQDALLFDVAAYDSGPEVGKIVTAGVADTHGDNDLLLVRLNPDGSLDPSFGQGGIVTTRIQGGSGSGGSIALDSAGRVLLVGHRLNISPAQSVILRFNRDGTLDDGGGAPGSGFGLCGCGFVDPPGDVWDIAFDDSGSDSGEILYSGTELVGGSGETVATAGRFAPGGGLLWDRRFSTTANPTAPQPGWGEGTTSVAQSPDGKMVIGGTRLFLSSQNHSQREVGALRLHPNGTFDTSFGVGGGVSHDVSGTVPFQSATSVHVDQSERVLFSTVTNAPAVYCGGGSVIRLAAGGALDTSFAGDGISTFGGALFTEVAVDSQGRIVAGGSVDCRDTVSQDAGAIRLLPNGGPDPAFGQAGRARMVDSDFGKHIVGHGMALDERGVIVAADVGNEPALARFLAEPTAEGNPDSPGSGGVAGGVATNARNVRVHKLVVPKSREKLAALGVKVLASCAMDCRILLEVRVSQAVANAMGLRGTLLARGSRPADVGQRRWVLARPTGAARRALRSYQGGGRLQVNVTGVPQ